MQVVGTCFGRSQAPTLATRRDVCALCKENHSVRASYLSGWSGEDNGDGHYGTDDGRRDARLLGEQHGAILTAGVPR